jgi:hypothetical protein
VVGDDSGRATGPDEGWPAPAPAGTTRKAVASIVAAVAFIVAAGVLTLAYFILAVAPDRPLLVLAASAVGAIVTIWLEKYKRVIETVVNWIADSILVRKPKPTSSPGSTSQRVPARWSRWVAAAVVALAVAATLVSETPPLVASCPHPTELRVLTSPDSLEPTRELTGAYALSTADAHGHCPTVFPFVYAATSRSAGTSALARGWRADDTQNPQVTLGPVPDVWLPDSTVDVRQVNDLAVKEHLASSVRTVTPIASSPMVLATSADAVDGGDTWLAAVARLLDGSRPLSAPDPEASSTGLLAAEGYLTAGGTLVGPALARHRVQAVLGTGAGAGSDSATLLCGYRRPVGDEPAGSIPVSVLTSRQLLRRFLAGRPLGDRCMVQVPDRSGGLVVIAASTAPVLDHPFVDFAWTTPARRPTVDAFRRWLTSSAGRERLTDLGLDAPRPECASLEHNPCVPPELDRMQDLYERVKVPGRVLLALDVSGSMANRAGPVGVSRFQTAVRGVTQALNQMGSQDEFGLWVFPGPAGRTENELVTIGRGTSQQRALVTNALGAERPIGPTTPLYRAIVDAMVRVGGTGTNATDEPIRALVVLTDGEDTSSAMSADQAEGRVRELAVKYHVRLYVIATGDARCEDPGDGGLQRLTDAGRGRCFETGPDAVPDTMTELLGFLWSGR